MSATPDHRRLAAIMFTDMVGYSALCQKDERLASELLEDHRRMVRAALAVLGGREVDTTGDGFLLEYQSAVQAVQCAILIQQRQAERNASVREERRFQFRVGIHLGEIETREHNIVGDGVNIAARLEPLSPHGGVAISGAVHSLVRNRISADFRSIGAPALKNISEPVEVFVLDPDRIAAVRLASPDAAGARKVPAPSSHRWKVVAIIAAAVVAIVISGNLRKRGATAPPPAADKSVAVLPFANFSSDEENEYFAAGIHDSILTHLARVKDLKVISRTSVMQYKDGARNLREIGKALGVAGIVEGSVQKAGNRVRVQAQLIEAQTDRHLWAESYDRELADVFAIQSEVAERIVAAVQATLTDQEKGRIERRPTANPEAYDLYLRAEELDRQPNSISRDFLFRIQALLEQAVALDPEFALAYAALARTHIEMYWWGIETTARRRDLGRVAAETAVRLQPDLGEAHLAMGMYYYHGFRDYERALQKFDEALSRSPGSAEVHAWIGYVERRLGHWDSALAKMARAAALDPRNPRGPGDLGSTYLALRRYPEAVAAFDQALALAPDDPVAKITVGAAHLLWKGDPGPIKATLAEIPPGVDPGQVPSVFRIMVALHEARYTDAISLLTAYPLEGMAMGPVSYEVPKEFYLGRAYAALNQDARARPHFIRAAESLRTYIAREPGSVNLADTHAYLGLTLAYLGERAEAQHNAERALELLPVSRDAFAGPQVAQIVAAIRARLGDADHALQELDRSLKLPGGAQAHLLPRDPDWKPLWSDPRFQKLVADHLPKT